MKFPANPRSSTDPRRRGKEGYILLVLLLFIALLTIGAVAIAPSIAFQVRRDREEEMIHRGVQYSRAVRHYYKKFNRYPSKIEDLENTNNIRFLRKRYKDPVTGDDFKVVHLSEVQMALAGAAVGSAGSSLNDASSSGFGSGSSGPGGKNTPQPGSAGPSSADGTASPSGFGTAGAAKSSGDSLTGKTFGGGPIAGVVSTSKKESIREFNKKNHYNQWLFIYDPQSDRGGLLSTPAQPPLVGAAPVSPTGGGAAGAPGSAFGTPGMAPAAPPSAPAQQPDAQPQQ